MTPELIASFVSPLISGAISAIVAIKLISYRLTQLEKKVEKHNNLIDRMYKVEKDVAILQEEVDEN